MFFKYLQGWWLHQFPEQPVLMPDYSFSKEFFSNIQSKCPLAWLKAVFLCSVACYVWEETNPHLAATSFQVAVESDKVTPKPPFLQAEDPWFLQPFHIRTVLQTLLNFTAPSVVRGPKLKRGFELWAPCQSCILCCQDSPGTGRHCPFHAAGPQGCRRCGGYQRTELWTEFCNISAISGLSSVEDTKPWVGSCDSPGHVNEVAWRQQNLKVKARKWLMQSHCRETVSIPGSKRP